MKAGLLLTAATFAAVSTVALRAQSAPTPSTEPITVHDACTTHEKWTPEDPKTTYIKNRIELSRKGGPEATSGLLRAVVAIDQVKPKDVHGKTVISYWYARALYDSKQVHLAHDAFLNILKQPPEIDKLSDGPAIRTAAMMCLSQIHHEFPTLTMDPESLAAVQQFVVNPKLTAEQRTYFYEGMGWELKKHFRPFQPSLSEADANAFKTAFNGNGYYEKLLAIMRASEEPDEAAILANESIFNEKDFASRPETEKDLLHVVFGQAYYGEKKWEKALAHFKQIPNTSNEIVKSISASSWVYLQQEHYPEAIGSATNLVLGGLSKTFQPEAYETLSMALLETCNYDAALQTYQHFRKIYGKPYFFLRDAQKSGLDLYGTLSAFLLGKLKGKVPDRVGTEWSADPVFLANQSEINLGMDEAASAVKIRVAARNWVNFAKSSSWKKFDNYLTIIANGNSARQPTLTAEISRAILTRSRLMFGSLNQAAQALQLLEAEAYEQIGDKYLAENGPNKGGKDPVGKTLKPKQDGGAVWDWGRYPAEGTGDEDTTETWEDELGYLRAKIKDSCK
jgi:tetratricopeptide (TPR) repeat protein